MRTLLVFGVKNFKLEIPDDAKITFGPFSPPTKGGFGQGGQGAVGTLRVYRAGPKDENIIGVFTGVYGFRDTDSMKYMEEVAKEEGAVIWKSDKDGYQREEKVQRVHEFLADPMAPKAIAAPKRKR